MASLRIRCAGGSSLCSMRRDAVPNGLRVRACSLAIPDQLRTDGGAKGVSMSSNRRRFEPLVMGPGLIIDEDEDSDTRDVATRRMDNWIDISAPEIVKNLDEAPLFVQLYEKSRVDGQRCLMLKTEKGVGADHWDAVRAEWEKGAASLPEGVIFVEELIDDDEISGGVRTDDDGGRVEKIWGMVVQSKGADFGVPAFYLMKTTRVSSGTGHCAVHFWATKVNNFREKARTQLDRLWLVR